jgi:D-alanyl-D-alanine carboxypeptidase/D-alanyl-D-alanine-endopeptidase (penicillin-binding protein 4)
VLVVDLDHGKPVVAHDPTRALVPASAAKVVTAAAALEQWGPTFRFETPVLADGHLDGEGVLQGDLWIVGRGDPTLVSEQLWRLAEELRLQGLREVRGRLGIDSSYFDRVLWHPDWPTGTRRAYKAPVSAFAANYSSFRVEVSPAAEVGRPLRLLVAPAVPYFRVEAGGRTLERPGGLHVEVEPRPDGWGEVVRVRGSMGRSDETQTYWRSVVYPEAYAGQLLRAQLQAQGISVRGGTQIGTAPTDARELLRFQGETLGRIVWKLNKFSNNFIAENLTKSLGAVRYGAPGTWGKGRRALAEYLEGLGGLGPGEVIVEGSGLSPRNRLSPQSLVKVVRAAAQPFEWGPEFLASLPLGGLDGTLEDRLEQRARPVRAKTGHLSGVAALCGMVPDSTGRVLVFAVLVNGARGSAEAVDAALDSFVMGLGERVPDPG